MDCREVKNCRACGGELSCLIAFGEMCLGGQFPKQDEPDPPAFPLELWRCDCGLVQLGHTVNPELMFRQYGYRSGVTDTMKAHLKALAREAVGLPLRVSDPARALDIGGNDGTLLASVPDSWQRVNLDPSDVTDPHLGHLRLRGFFPDQAPDGPFDLIFSVACFYDADDPVKFARAVRDRLAPHGLWCLEVADWSVQLAMGSYDGVCHEHLCYYDLPTLRALLSLAGLRTIRWSANACNGGSLRLYACRATADYADVPLGPADTLDCADYAQACRQHRNDLYSLLVGYKRENKTVHLLGASTKANTWLQYVYVTPELVQMASDRDPRKKGRVTPGTRIPIVGEEYSRTRRPDVYLVGPSQFRAEIVEREKGFLARGGELAFVTPRIEVVRA